MQFYLRKMAPNLKIITLRENNHGVGEECEQITRDYFADFCKNMFKNLDGIDNFPGKYYAPNRPIRDRKLISP